MGLEFRKDIIRLWIYSEPWPVWLDWALSRKAKRLPVWFLVRARAWVVSSVSGWGVLKRQLINVSHIDVSVPLFFPSPLSKSKTHKRHIFKRIHSETGHKGTHHTALYKPPPQALKNDRQCTLQIPPWNLRMYEFNLKKVQPLLI